ncbi:MAG TPA: DegV family protein [Acidimicrobiales bacterium]|nr:DegV family protein [Acidimicrobiales bacterium]
MSGVYVVSDSSCDLDPDETAPLNIEIVPLSIRFGDEEFTDRRNLSVEEFYKRMADSDVLPQTACPSPGAFERAFCNASDAGADAVICLTLSSALSNTYQSAQTAAATCKGRMRVEVIDSRAVSSGLGTLVLEAAQAARDGADAERVRQRVADLVPRTHVIAALNTVENLKRGGRIGGAKAIVGSLLSIKPLIDVSGGAVQEAGRARTRKRAMEWLYERMRAAGPIERVAVMHGEAPDIDGFLALIAPDFPRGTFRVGRIGAVIGTHGGAEMIGVSWIAAAQEMSTDARP